jgi:hypothetical protein
VRGAGRSGHPEIRKTNLKTRKNISQRYVPSVKARIGTRRGKRIASDLKVNQIVILNICLP